MQNTVIIFTEILVFLRVRVSGIVLITVDYNASDDT
jgi:hypothetical protein